jgi:hypothetical protein
MESASKRWTWMKRRLAYLDVDEGSLFSLVLFIFSLVLFIHDEEEAALGKQV